MYRDEMATEAVNGKLKIRKTKWRILVEVNVQRHEAHFMPDIGLEFILECHGFKNYYQPAK